VAKAGICRMQLYLELFSSQTEGDTSTDGLKPTLTSVHPQQAGGISGEEWKHGPGIPRLASAGNPGVCTSDKPASAEMLGVQHSIWLAHPMYLRVKYGIREGFSKGSKGSMSIAAHQQWKELLRVEGGAGVHSRNERERTQAYLR